MDDDNGKFDMALRKSISEGLRGDGQIGNRVAELRQQKGLTLVQLAQKVGVSDTCVWNWERGNTKPRRDSLARLAAGLDTTHAHLLRGEPALPASEAPDGETQSLPELVRQARENIAAVAGIPVHQVRITLDYSG